MPINPFADKLKKDAELDVLAVQNRGLKGVKALRELSKIKGESFKINPYAMKIDYTPRDIDSETTKKHIDELARSAKEHGIIVPLTVYWRDGRVVVSIGVIRLLGAIRAIEIYGAEIWSIPVRAETLGTDECIRVIDQIAANIVKPLNHSEICNAYQRLIGFGWTAAKIAAQTGISVAEINSILAGEAEDRDPSVGQLHSGELNEENIRLKQENTRLKEENNRLNHHSAITERDLARKEIEEIKNDPAYPEIAVRLEQKAKKRELRELKEVHEQGRAILAAQQKREIDELVARQRAEVESLQPSNNSLGANRSKKTVPISATNKKEHHDDGGTNRTPTLTRETVRDVIKLYAGRPYFTINQIRTELHEFRNEFADTRSFSKAISSVLDEFVKKSRITKLELPLRGKWSIS